MRKKYHPSIEYNHGSKSRGWLGIGGRAMMLFFGYMPSIQISCMTEELFQYLIVSWKRYQKLAWVVQYHDGDTSNLFNIILFWIIKVS
jgi:hypothetical protein